MKKIIHQYCQGIENTFHTIGEKRKTELTKLSNYVQVLFITDLTPKIVMIGTDNSRCSQIAQIWLTAAADYYLLPLLRTYSGGINPTNFDPSEVNRLKHLGFEITTNSTRENPRYSIKWSDKMQPYMAFSKRYDDLPNPYENFGAIITSPNARKYYTSNMGAEFLLYLPYPNHKHSKNNQFHLPNDKEIHEQIAKEMLWTMKSVKQALYA